MSPIGAWVYSATLEHTLCHVSMVKKREDPWLSVFTHFPLNLCSDVIQSPSYSLKRRLIPGAL